MFWKLIGGCFSLLGAFGLYAGSVGGIDPAIQDMRELFDPIPPKIVSFRESKKGFVRAVARNDSRRPVTILGIQGERTNPEYIVVTGRSPPDAPPLSAIQLIDQATADAGPKDVCENEWVAKFDRPIELAGRASGTVLVPVKGDKACTYKARLVTDRGFSDWIPLDRD